MICHQGRSPPIVTAPQQTTHSFSSRPWISVLVFPSLVFFCAIISFARWLFPAAHSIFGSRWNRFHLALFEKILAEAKVRFRPLFRAVEWWMELIFLSSLSSSPQSQNHSCWSVVFHLEGNVNVCRLSPWRCQCDPHLWHGGKEVQSSTSKSVFSFSECILTKCLTWRDTSRGVSSKGWYCLIKHNRSSDLSFPMGHEGVQHFWWFGFPQKATSPLNLKSSSRSGPPERILAQHLLVYIYKVWTWRCMERLQCRQDRPRCPFPQLHPGTRE